MMQNRQQSARELATAQFWACSQRALGGEGWSQWQLCVLTHHDQGDTARLAAAAQTSLSAAASRGLIDKRGASQDVA